MGSIVPYEVICADTTKLGRPQWLALRKPYLCSSDVAGIMAMSHYCSPYSVFCEKRNLTPESEQSDFFAWKLSLEGPILDWVEVNKWVTGPIRRHMMLASVEYPWLASNPDGFTDSECVEAKALHGMDEKRWDLGVPDMYFIQAMVHMIVTGLGTCLLPVCFGNNPPREFWVDYDPELAEVIIARTGAFWQQIQDGIEPDADASEATMSALRERYYEVEEGESVELPADTLPWFGLRDAHLAIIKAETEAIDGIKARLMQLLGDAPVGKLAGDVVCTWHPRKDGKRVFLFKEIKN
jgi:putative phage-type endonuclease